MTTVVAEDNWGDAEGRFKEHTINPSQRKDKYIQPPIDEAT